MTRVHLTALVATLALGAVAVPRLAAQDTSAAAGQARSDTSGYTGAGGVDTSANPGRVGSGDSTRVGQQAPVKTRHAKRRLHPASDSMRDTLSAPGRADRDSAGALGATDSSGMRGRHPDTTKVGDSTSAKPGVTLPSDTDAGSRSSDAERAGGSPSDSSGMAQPTRQPGQSTSPSGQTGDSSRSQ
jgi:hypothetical protein